MTGGQFGEVDFDLLADYVGGALAGTPGEAEVARLIASNTTWAQAYAEVTTAVDAVGVDLASWGAVPEPMPDAVTARLTAALAEAVSLADAPLAEAVPLADASLAEDANFANAAALADVTTVRAPSPATEPADPGERPGRRPAGAPHGGVASSGPGRAARSRRRWSRLAGPVAVAAAVTAFAGFGLPRLTGSDGADRSSGAAVSGPGAERAEGDRTPANILGAPQAPVDAAAMTSTSSGTNYAASTLADRVAALSGQRINTTETDSGEQPNGTPEQSRAAGAYGLERLSDRGALTGCLDAVARAHGGAGTLTVDIVDYAKFEGSPALVISFTDQAGTRWAWAVGPECGLPNVGTDERHHTRVG
ncbi:hypothetical protein GCM10027280_28950 [Micromonospora polyrhachis]|uniref:Uncharacterized protein n=1 Tax=Micromonospora polyrhachis TaxID=1282883 RepID=A0A7W7SQK2_9ACTN|nr:hypothetical protein [Micromonospora polyrhachis]MBB4959124.1 hypothetical protein [Micromonospora polyrhachis]